MLNITNGDAAIGVMRKAGIAGDFLPWRDVLHEGPVPAHASLQELSAIRARYIADCGWAEPDEAARQFRQRDETIAGFHEHEEVILWFEHDLYDQLQLLQLLDFFSGRDLGRTDLNMICVDEYLGLMSPGRMGEVRALKRPVSADQLRLGKRAWSAFCAPDPLGWHALLDEDTSALPFLAGAVLRHLQQFPSVENGLGRTQRQILKAVRSGAQKPGEIFEADQAMEERLFMGDSSFWIYLSNLAASPSPLLNLANESKHLINNEFINSTAFQMQTFALTDAGSQVLAHRLDAISLRGIDRWLGGAHLTADCHWRWDESNLLLTETGTANPC